VPVPPVPWRRIAVGGAVALVLLGGAAAVVVPAIDRGKDEGAARRQAARKAYVHREEVRLRRDQRPRSGHAAPGSPRAIVAALAGAITADARARVRAGTIDGPILRTDCERAFGGRLDPRSGRAIYKCLAVQGEPIDPRHQERIVKGYDFIATVDLRRGAYSWCKLNILPGEHNIENIPHVRPSRQCAGAMRPIL
jgi:hypothetical protein